MNTAVEPMDKLLNYRISEQLFSFYEEKGMSPDVKQRVFDHLFTTKPVGQGTGLGLAIARQIVVEAHGGSLSCTSEVGQGKEFVIQISTQQQ
jgi:signal transduction histidine kinase